MPTLSPTTGQDIFDAVFEHTLHFRIEMDYDVLCQFVRRIGQYNDFRAETVLDALDRIDQRIPRTFYGEGNPNSGQRSYTVSIGREGSPVLYLDRYEWNHDDRLSDEQIQFICREMQVNGRADEADYEVTPTLGGHRKVSFRFWWD